MRGDKDILNNLNINNTIDLSSNSYKDLSIELIVKEAVKYVINKTDMPRDLKRVLCYYGIIDHFYPDDGGAMLEGDAAKAAAVADSVEMYSSPRSVERARARRQVSDSAAED